jgi:hypothetical protein
MDDLTRFLRPAGGGVFTVSTDRTQRRTTEVAAGYMVDTLAPLTDAPELRQLRQ